MGTNGAASIDEIDLDLGCWPGRGVAPSVPWSYGRMPSADVRTAPFGLAEQGGSSVWAYAPARRGGGAGDARSTQEQGTAMGPERSVLAPSLVGVVDRPPDIYARPPGGPRDMPSSPALAGIHTE